jgi:hypothetical protein
MNGENMANYTQFIKESDAILARTRGMINKHYRDIWTDPSKTWAERQAALFMIMDGVSRQAGDFLKSSIFADFGSMDATQDISNPKVADAIYNLGEDLYNLN